MLKLLVVDDEEHLLHGLRRLLHSHRKTWKMTFCVDAQEALRLIDDEAFNLLITDMRMPEVEGSRLLFETFMRSPTTLRCVLSGQSEHHQVCKVTGTAHQFLSKPTQKQDLELLLQRAEWLAASPLDETLRLAASRLAALPCQAHVLRDLERELCRDGADVSRVAELITSDVGMSAKVVQLVWSSFFGLPRRSLCAVEAIEQIGLEMLRELVFEYGIFSPHLTTEPDVFSLEELCRESLVAATEARAAALALGQDESRAKQAYFAGLTHQIGKLVLAHQFPEKFVQVRLRSSTEGISLLEAEQQVFGASHVQVGSYLLALWGFPLEVIATVASYPHASLAMHDARSLEPCV